MNIRAAAPSSSQVKHFKQSSPSLLLEQIQCYFTHLALVQICLVKFLLRKTGNGIEKSTS